MWGHRAHVRAPRPRACPRAGPHAPVRAPTSTRRPHAAPARARLAHRPGATRAPRTHGARDPPAHRSHANRAPTARARARAAAILNAHVPLPRVLADSACCNARRCVCRCHCAPSELAVTTRPPSGRNFRSTTSATPREARSSERPAAPQSVATRSPPESATGGVPGTISSTSRASGCRRFSAYARTRRGRTRATACDSRRARWARRRIDSTPAAGVADGSRRFHAGLGARQSATCCGKSIGRTTLPLPRKLWPAVLQERPHC